MKHPSQDTMYHDQPEIEKVPLSRLVKSSPIETTAAIQKFATAERMRKRLRAFVTLLFLGLWMVLGSEVRGQVTVTYDFSESDETGLDANPPIALDANIGFSSHKNGGTSNPVINNGQLRLYQNATKGGSIKIYAQNGVIITNLVVYASHNDGDGPAGYSVDNTTEVGTFPDGTTVYTISNLSAVEFVEFYNKGTSATTRTYVDYFEVTYIANSPTLIPTPSTLTGLSYMEGGGPSMSQSFSLSGINLEPAGGNIVVTAPPNFEVSEDDEDFFNSLIIPYTDGSLAATNIYVRLVNELPIGSYNGYITILGGDAPNTSVAVAGEVWEYSNVCGEEDFETGTKNSYGEGNVDLTTGNWHLTGALLGNSTNDRKYGSKSVRVQSSGSFSMNFNETDGIGTVTVFHAKYGNDNNNTWKLQASTDNGATWTAFESPEITTNSTILTSVDFIVNISIPVRLRILKTSGGTNQRINFDNISWTCYSGCPPTLTISSLGPLSGPKETVVKITGTNFIIGGLITDVQFGGVPASSYNVLSDTEMTAVVPDIAVSGTVTVYRGNCEAMSSETFTLLEEDCQTGTASLIISELCDPQSDYQTSRYIEIYNPSDVAVNLTGWTLYSLSNASNINDQSGVSWGLSGMIQSGEAMTCGFTSPVNGGPNDFTHEDWYANETGGGAYNWNGDGRDGAALYNGTTLVDAVLIYPHNPDPSVPNPELYKDRVLLRNSDVCSPNPNSPLSEWTVSEITSAGFGSSTPRLHSSCILLTGADPSIITETTPNISEPICNAPTITVTATSASEISYQWYYNDGTASWTEIIDNAVFSGATTPTLSITNLVGLENYQFYCRLITDLACINYSGAIQVEVLPNDKIYFKSKNSGLWSDPETWEFSTDISDPYSDACIYPNSSNAILVEIETGQTVTYDLANTETIPSVWVLSGSTLQTQSNRNLRIENVDPTAELIVDGTYIDNATSGSSIAFLNGATWQLGAGGTIVKTNTSSVIQYRNNYEGLGGIENIPATANWIYRKIGPNDITVATIDMVYPNLSFENELLVGGYTPTSSLHVFSGSSSSLRIKGDLKVGDTGAQPYNMATNNTNINPILVEGDLYIGAGSSLTNIADGIVGTGFEIRGYMDIQGTLDLSFGSGSNVGVLKLTGDEMVALGGSTVSVNHLVIDKNIDEQLLTDLSFSIEESAQFLNGILELENETNVFTFQAGAITSGASNASFVNGRVRKSANTGEDFTFPIGDTKGDTIAWYQPARIFGNSGNTTIAAQYFAEAHPEAGPYHNGSTQNNQHIGTCDFWRVEKVSGVDVRLGFTYINPDDTTYCNDVGSANHLTMHRWNGLAWDPPGNGVDPTSGEGIGEIRVGLSGVATEYGDFALSSTNGDLNVLPIELLRFEAVEDGAIVQTAWATSSESNNAFFTVERSADARTFQPIGKVDGAGNSHTTLHYAFTDQKPLYGISYYRLKQTDFDGHYTYSDIRAVSFSESTGFSLDLTYRNENDLNLVYTAISPYILVEIFDVLGKRVFTQVAENYGGQSTLTPNLGRGAYVVRISSGAQTDSGKIVW